MAAAVAAVAATAATFRLAAPARLALVGLALAAAGLWWGGLRLHELDRSFLSEQIGRPAAAQVVVTGAAGRSPFAVRVPARVRRFDGIALRERVLLELPAGRAPPQGAVLELRARPVAPRGPETGFDERGWLARRGIHVVLHASGSWQIVGRRGGIGGVGDRLRTAIATLSRSGRRASGARSSSGSCSEPTRASIPASGRVQGLRPLPPPRGVGPEHRADRFRRPRARIRGRTREGNRSRARDRRDPLLRSRRRLAAVGRPCCGGRLPGIGRVAAVPAERALAHDGRGGCRAARLDASVPARARLSALLRRGRCDLPHAAATPSGA